MSLTNADMLGVLRRACKDAGSAKAWSVAHGFSGHYASMMLCGHRPVSEAVANALGYMAVTRFHQIRNASDEAPQ